MPTVVEYTPAWLSRPSPGFDLFSSRLTEKFTKENRIQRRTAGPLRTITRRNAEIIVAVDNELRWSDLVLLRNDWEATGKFQELCSTGIVDAENQPPSYRVLKVPVHGEIKQLIISPRGDYLAILTSHTVHVAILPSVRHLGGEDTSPLRLKTFHIGPATHVLEQSPIASAQWHPLGVGGACLVTVTEDAVVRLWELNKDNRWSFDSPALAVDLRKLANGVIADEDVTPSKYGQNKGFSPDSFEMEVAAACFGGSGDDKQNPWASTTLWVAMRQGDIYGLSPLLPSKWEASSNLVQNLCLSVAVKAATVDSDDNASKVARQVSNQQFTWTSELGVPEQSGTSGASSLEHSKVYQRPARPGPIPKLQGPLHLVPDADELFDITDIYVIGASQDMEYVEDNFGSSTGHESLPVGIICVATGDGKIHVCLDVDGLEGEWLPAKPTQSCEHDRKNNPALLFLETMTICKPTPSCWPTFTPDVQSRHALFVTHSGGVSHVDFSSWTKKLTDELGSASGSGVGFRVNLLVENVKSVVEHIIQLPTLPQDPESSECAAARCISLQDSDLGCFLLTTANGQPHAATINGSDVDQFLIGAVAEYPDTEIKGLVTSESRPSYQPPQELWSESALSNFMDEQSKGRNGRSMKEEIKLSPMTLKLIMEAHRLLSQETHQLGLAAAEMFRRCERLQEEFQEQIRVSNEAATRIDAVLDDNVDAYDSSDELDGVSANIDRRLDTARSRQEHLTERYTNLRRKLSRLDGRLLNEKEKAWMEEVDKMNVLVCGSGPDVLIDTIGAAQKPPWQRLKEVERWKTELLVQHGDHSEKSSIWGPFAVSMASPTRKKAKLTDIASLLERQTALVEATRNKLARLSTLSR